MRIPIAVKPLILCSLALLLVAAPWSPARAQELSAEEILDEIQRMAEATRDASFVLTGRLIEADGEEIRLEIEGQIIPGEELGRATFIRPDSLADNFIILDGDTVYNYLFVTNQVTIFRADDPDAFGGLFPEVEAEVEQQFDLSFNVERLVEGWQVSTQGYEESPVGNVYLLRFENDDAAADIRHIDAKIIDQEWLPYQLEFYHSDGSLLAELEFQHIQRDTGLDPRDVRYIPGDAERIDER